MRELEREGAGPKNGWVGTPRNGRGVPRSQGDQVQAHTKIATQPAGDEQNNAPSVCTKMASGIKMGRMGGAWGKYIRLTMQRMRVITA